MKVIIKMNRDSANSEINHDCEATIDDNYVTFVLENPYREFSVVRNQLEFALSYKRVL